MVAKNSRKKGGDTKCLEKLQEQQTKLMESCRSLLSVEVSFLFPTMAGIQHLNKLNELGQAWLLVTFLVMGYIGMVALILSHSTDAMKWSAVVSSMTLMVTVVWLGIFHIIIGLLTPHSYMKAYAPVNIVLFICIVLLIGSQWKRLFRPPKCGEKTPNENLKKDGDTKRLEKLQEQHNKLMESVRSLLTSEVSFLIPTIVGITHLDRFGEGGHAAVLVSFLLMGYLGTIALILSHSTESTKWSAFVSFMTVVVTVAWIVLFHFTIAMMSARAYGRICVVVNDFLCIGGVLVIGCLWHIVFPQPKS